MPRHLDVPCTGAITQRRPTGGAAALLCAMAMVLAPRISAAAPRLAMALRAGTPGVGLDLDVGFSRRWGMRLGYSALDVNHSLATSEVQYRGTLKLSVVTALLDWHPFRGAFHLSAGLADDLTELDVVGQPRQGTYTFNGTVYSARQIGSLTGRAQFTHALGPYVGLGWGNPTAAHGRVHFLFDIGAIYGGAPRVTLNAQCGSASPPGSPLCASAQTNVVGEQRALQRKLDVIDWYPVVSLGVAVRF